jgi:hypothetical protein
VTKAAKSDVKAVNNRDVACHVLQVEKVIKKTSEFEERFWL